MTKQANESLLIDLNFRTGLLESLAWDENQFDSLIDYLQKTISEGVQAPSLILEHIADEYGDAASEFIKEMFVDTYINYGIYLGTGGDYEHWTELYFET